ncbi:MAG: radical SAM protein [Thermoprotei archaeon]|nr:radical SAM protein [Thermoprotei archaeon]
MRVRGDFYKGVIGGHRLARGCELCYPGAKAVVFVSGACDDSCFYCPVSRARLYSEVMFVNEEPVSTVGEVVIEVLRMGARGASITGGDPLAALDRTVAVVGALKEGLGQAFHIHLYTTGRQASIDSLRVLARVGLDEIRFHPVNVKFLKAVEKAKSVGLEVGVEIPIAPGLEEWAIRVISEAYSRGASFVNLNEMEFVEPNAENLLARGYRESRLRPFTVEGALEAAMKVLEWAGENSKIPVHFCPAPFKDSIQTRNRFKRLAKLDRAWYEHPTRDGTLIWGELRGATHEIGEECGPASTCTPPDTVMLKQLASRYGAKAYIVEALPTRSRVPVSLQEIF